MSLPSPPCTGVGRQRGGGDDLEAGRPQSADELRRSEGDLDTCEHLGLAHAAGTSTIDGETICSLNAGVGTRKDTGQGQDDKCEQRRTQTDAQGQPEQSDQAQRRQGAHSPGDGHGHTSPLAGVTDPPSQRHAD